MIFMDDTIASFEIIKHYIKDLSVENPFGSVMSEDDEPVQLAFSMNLEIQSIDEENRVFEVIINAETQHIDDHDEDQIYLLCSLSYALEVQFNDQFPESLYDKVLNVNIPQLAFSTIRGIIMQNCLYSGYSQVEFDPIDFEEVFLSLQAEQEAN